MQVQIARLEGFYWVARSGGYAAAARVFPYPITQPGVHRQVKKLEEELGRKLFERIGPRTLALTDSGRELYSFCRPFFEGLTEAIERARYPESRLRVDAGQLELNYLLPNWIRAYEKLHPEVRVELYERETVDWERLATGAADIAIDHFDVLPDEFDRRIVGHHRVYFLRSKSRQRLKLEDIRRALRDRPFIAFSEETREHGVQMALLSASDVDVRVRAAASTVMGIVSLVRSGLGVSVVPWPVTVKPRFSGVDAWPVPGVEPFPIYATWLKTRSRDARIRELLEAIL